MIQYPRYLFLFISLVLFERPWFKRKAATDVSICSFRVMPWDIDLNLHLTNARYPAFLDVARTKWFFEMGMVPLIIKDGWRTVLASQTMTFVREIKPFAKVVIESRVVFWDRKYLYTEHRFLVDGRLHCKTLGRVAMIRGGRVRAFDSLLRAVDRFRGDAEGVYESPQASPEIMANIELLNRKRQSELDRESLES